MSRRTDLEEWIRQSYALIREYEGIVQTSDRPEEKARATRIMREQWGLIGKYLTEYRRLAGDALPPDIAEIATCFAQKGHKNSRSDRLPAAQRVAIIVAVIGLVGTIAAAIIKEWPGPVPPPTSVPTLPPQPPYYQVRVEVKGTGDYVPDAMVSIEVIGRAPLEVTTDSNGFARLMIPAALAGQPGHLIVEATGYRIHRQNIDLIADALPVTIQLEPIVPSPTPTCLPQAGGDEETITRLIHAEAEAVLKEDILIIRAIFAENAVIRDGGSEEQWNDPISRYNKLFAETRFTDAVHFDIQPAGPGISGNVAYFTSGSRGSYVTTDGYSGSYDHPPCSDHWTFSRNGAACWVITEFTFNACHIPFPP